MAYGVVHFFAGRQAATAPGMKRCGATPAEVIAAAEHDAAPFF